ncbi:hypothetical protein [Vibrio harveyi]|uniref:hypothetical protein n=1 Tax=Vibrio harveyi TaxID=669 RepID=UPI003CFAAFF2
MISLILADLISQMEPEDLDSDKQLKIAIGAAELRLSSVAIATGLYSATNTLEPIDLLGNTLKRYVPEANRHYPMVTDQMDMELLDWITGVDHTLKSMPTQVLLPFALSLRRTGQGWLALSDLIVTYAKSDEIAHDILVMMQITEVIEKDQVHIEVPTKVERLCETLYDETLMDAVYVAYDALCSECFRDTVTYLREQESHYAIFLGSYWYEIIFGVDADLSLTLIEKIRVSHPALWGVLEEHYRENPPKVSQRKNTNGLVNQLKQLMHF